MRQGHRDFYFSSTSWSNSRWWLCLLLQLPSIGVGMCYMVRLILSLLCYTRLTASISSLLPVRGMWMHCSICSHGGHYECYRKFYSSLSRFDFPLSSDPSLTTRLNPTRHHSGYTGTLYDSQCIPPSELGEGSSNSRALGLPCAAGCGHRCFAGNEEFLTSRAK